MREENGRLVLRSTGRSYADGMVDGTTSRGGFVRRFNQSEEFLLEFDTTYEVPPLPIHHDVNQLAPSERYLAAVDDVMTQTAGRFPQLLGGLECAFDPMHASWSIFYRLMEHNQASTLFLITLDLSYRPLEHQVVERGSNDIAPRYRTRRLYLTVDLIPVVDVERRNSELLVQIERSISQTWIGETGRGYVTQGVWIDRDLNRFFTGLFLPPGVRVYPWFPFHAKFRSLCHSPLELTADSRTRAADLLAQARSVILPRMDDVLETLRSQPFSTQLPLFREMKKSVDLVLEQRWHGIRIEPYLNDQNMKEYLVEWN